MPSLCFKFESGIREAGRNDFILKTPEHGATQTRQATRYKYWIMLDPPSRSPSSLLYMMAFLSILLVAVSLVTININAQSRTGKLSAPVIICLSLG